MRPPSGSLPCRNAWNSAGISLRQVRSPVPPKNTRANDMRDRIRRFGGAEVQRYRGAGGATGETYMRMNRWVVLVAASAFAGAAMAQQGQVNVICSVQADWCNMI